MSVYDSPGEKLNMIRSPISPPTGVSLDLSNRKTCRVYLFSNKKSLKPTFATEFVQARLDFQNRAGLWSDLADTIARHIHGVRSSDDVYISQVVYYKRRGQTPYWIATDLDCIRASVETGHTDLDQEAAVKIGVLYTAKRNLKPDTNLKELLALHGTAVYTCEAKHKEMVKGLRQLRAEGNLCDVVFIADDKKHFWCHRVVLASMCKMFRMRTLVGFERNCYLYDVDSDSLAMVLDYVYGEPMTLNLGNVLYVHKVATLLQIDSIQQFCEQVLLGLSWEENTVIEMIKEQMDLKPACLRFQPKSDIVKDGRHQLSAKTTVKQHSLLLPLSLRNLSSTQANIHTQNNISKDSVNSAPMNLIIENVRTEKNDRSSLSESNHENGTGKVLVKQEVFDPDFDDKHYNHSSDDTRLKIENDTESSLQIKQESDMSNNVEFEHEKSNEELNHCSSSQKVMSQKLKYQKGKISSNAMLNASSVQKVTDTENDKQSALKTQTETVSNEPKKRTLRKRKAKSTAKRNMEKIMDDVDDSNYEAIVRQTDETYIPPESPPQKARRIFSIKPVPGKIKESVLNNQNSGEIKNSDLISNTENSTETSSKNGRNSTSTSNYKHKCPICSAAYPSIKSLLIHRNETHSTPDFTCHVCSDVHDTSVELYEHMYAKHDIGHTFSQEIPCPECGEFMVLKEMLVDHMLAEHTVRLYTCPQNSCDYITQDSRENEKHLAKHNRSVS